MDVIDQKLSSLQHELAAARDKMRQLENMASDWGHRAALVEARIQGILEARELMQAEAEGAAKSKPKRQRSLSGPWQAIMAMASAVDAFDYDDLERFAAEIGHEVNRDTLRSQMSGYKGAGLVGSLGDGKFTVTASGRAAAGIPERETTREEQDEHDAAPTNQRRWKWAAPAPDALYTMVPTAPARKE
jgi:hypothetical protein